MRDELEVGALSGPLSLDVTLVTPASGDAKGFFGSASHAKLAG